MSPEVCVEVEPPAASPTDSPPVQPLIVTAEQHILNEQRRFPGASGEFSWLLSGITLATKMIAAKVRRAGLIDILGEHGEVNVQGEVQQKLDVYADEALFHCLGVRESVGILASEENEHPKTVGHNSPNAKYAVVFDPLDGSSNIDVNVSVGTTFSVLRRPAADKIDNPLDWVLQPGACQVAAGYVVYGSSTIMVYTVGNGVHGFTLDPAIGAYVLSHPDIRMPKRGKIYSVNEAYRDSFPPAYNAYLDKLRTGGTGKPYASRYIGSMVADFHRTLLKGGVFLYPPTTDHPGGKLRLLYEANPIAFIAEQAGGQATDGRQRILDIVPESIHQRTPLIVGSEFEMEEFARSVMTA
ncbi:MAG TPA: class 1 fructose-bisphosphatase [Pirellulaceae bacterium]|nr:class 1 fructose-bisphosphatase [Pirellulaceae bacterium]